MATLREAWRRLQALFRKKALDREFDEELAAHIELATQEHLRRGASLVEARRRALVELGGVAAAKEQHRDARGLPLVDALVQDLRYAVRTLRRTPGVTAVAVLSLALGIGANTAIFTLIESTLLRPIAVKHPERLRLLTWREQNGGWTAPNLGYLSPTFGTMYEQRVTPDGGIMHADFTPRMYREFRSDHTVFESLFAFKELGRVTAVVDGSAQPVNVFLVSGSFYRGMDITPAIGRAIGPNDEQPQGGSAVVISYQYWTRRFSRSPSVIGKTIKLNDVPVTIVGVNPDYFTGIEPGAHFEIWAPLNLPAAVYGNLRHGGGLAAQQPERSVLDEVDGWSLPMMGRLKPGVSDARAQSEMDALFQSQVDAHPGPLGAPFLKKPGNRPRFILQSAARGVDYLTDRYSGTLTALFALAGFVLLIACANVANLLLAKSAVRQREISLRLALGAGKGRIARQLLTEGLLLASMAGVAGVILGYCSRNAIPALLATPWRPNPFDTTLDLKVLLVSIATTFLTGVIFSLAPVWQSRRVEVNEALKERSRASTSLSKLRIGRVLVALQVGLCLVVLVGAGLCVKTFSNLRKMPLGFEPKGVLLLSLDPPRLRYPAGRIAELLEKLQGELRAISGVQSATFSGGPAGSYLMNGGRKFGFVADTAVDGRFFETMGIPILNGRAIDERDNSKGIQAVVVNRQFAREVFPNENPVGETFNGSDYDGSHPVTFQVVGVCADWHIERLRDPVWPAFYSAWIQAPYAGPVNFEVKIAGDEAGVVRRVRQVVRSVDPGLAALDMRTGTQQIDEALSEERLMACLAVVFGALALILAVIGLYGVMAYAVARRTNEIGIRVALGAQPRSLARMVLRETLALAAAGVAAGIPAVLSLNRILDHVLAPAWRNSFAYGTKPNDPVTLILAVSVLAATGCLAAYLPARRAARCDPTLALRHE